MQIAGASGNHCWSQFKIAFKPDAEWKALVQGSANAAGAAPPASEGAELQPDAELASAQLQPGLRAEYFLFRELSEMPQHTGNALRAIRRVDASVDFDSADAFQHPRLKENFHARWTGVLVVPQDGGCTFTLESDDGSQLFLNGKTIIDNSSLHPMQKLTKRLALKAGRYTLMVKYFQQWGGAGCKLYWKHGDREEVIPAAALFHLPE